MSLLFSIIHFYKISDVATCYKLLPVTFLKSIDLKKNGFAIEVGLIAKFFEVLINLLLKFNTVQWKKL